MRTRLNVFPFVMVCLAAIAGTGLAGYLYTTAERRSFNTETRNELVSIADMKVRQVTAWREERLADAEVVQLNPFTARAVLEDLNTGRGRGEIETWMALLMKSYHYTAVSLWDRDGRRRLGLPAGEPADDREREFVMQAIRGTEPILGDLQRDEPTGAIHMALATPFLSTSSPEPFGVLLLKIDPEQFLYPLIQSWPVPSRSAETLLVRREGNDVVYLNELRHRKDTALKLRLPITKSQLPAARGAHGYEGSFEGVDYRGVPVLAAAKGVPGSPWLMVAKVDSEEVLAPLRQRTRFAVTFFAVLAMALVAGIMFLWPRQTAKVLRASEVRYRRLFEAAKDGILILDVETQMIVDVNPFLIDLLGYPTGRLTGVVSVAPVFDNEGTCTHLVGSVHDITDRKRAEEERDRLQLQLAQAQKMESVGRLAGGVAHDFNNLLTVINGYSGLLLGRLQADFPFRPDLEEIYKAGGRAAELTRQLLAFSRRQVLQPRVLVIDRLIEGMLPMLARLLGEDVEVCPGLRAEAARVSADPNRLEQAVMNLVVNARDAMPGGGKLTIETDVVEWGKRQAESHPGMHAGRFVMLAVTDTGVGMDEETKNRIFEPFFTTKGVGKGTGLGLSMVHGIVAQSGGYVEVYNEKGTGTTFKIYLPAVTEVSADAGSPAPVPALGGKETVLVVEDQEEVRGYAVTVLEAYGYQVVQAADAGEALLLCEHDGRRIDLLLTDVVMPNVDGRETHRSTDRMPTRCPFAGL